MPHAQAVQGVGTLRALLSAREGGDLDLALAEAIGDDPDEATARVDRWRASQSAADAEARTIARLMGG